MVSVSSSSHVVGGQPTTRNLSHNDNILREEQSNTPVLAPLRRVSAATMRLLPRDFQVSHVTTTVGRSRASISLSPPSPPFWSPFSSCTLSFCVFLFRSCSLCINSFFNYFIFSLLTQSFHFSLPRLLIIPFFFSTIRSTYSKSS